MTSPSRIASEQAARDVASVGGGGADVVDRLDFLVQEPWRLFDRLDLIAPHDT
jgi:hypothetical protein